MSTTDETPTATEADAIANGLSAGKRWAVDVLETSRRVVIVESFTKSEAKHRAKNSAFWVEKGEALEVVKSVPKGSPREIENEGEKDTANPAPPSPEGKGKK